MTKSGVLNEKVVCREFRHTTQHGAMAGKISHEQTLQKSEAEFEKYRDAQKLLEKEQSLKEIEADIKKLGRPKK